MKIRIHVDIECHTEQQTQFFADSLADVLVESIRNSGFWDCLVEAKWTPRDGLESPAVYVVPLDDPDELS